MKRITVLCLLMAMSVFASAQIRLDFQAGLAHPTGNAFEYSKGLGLGYSIGVQYVPGIMDKQLSFGLVKDGNLLLAAGGDWNDKGFDLQASKLGFVGAKARFDLQNKGASPYAAISLGCASLKSYYIYDQYDANDPNSPIGSNDFAKGCLEKSRFAVKPELGVAFGWFTFGLGWLLPATFTDNNTGHSMKAGSIQYNIGIRIKID